LPDRQAVGIAKRGRRGSVRWSLGLTTLLLVQLAAPLPAAELDETAEAVEAALAETPEAANGAGTGVDIRIADLLAGGSVLAGVAPRPATSGIGADLERDLFASGAPLNAPVAPPPENDPLPSY
jgi:hypothetical protein